MVALIEEHRAEIEALCRKHRVKRLEVFGSAARGDFVDFVSAKDVTNPYFLEVANRHRIELYAA